MSLPFLVAGCKLQLLAKKKSMIETPVHQVQRVSILIILKLPSQIKVWSGEHPPFFNRLFLNELNQEKDFESHKQILPKLFPTKIFKSYKNYTISRNYKNLLIWRGIINSRRSHTVEHLTVTVRAGSGLLKSSQMLITVKMSTIA